MALVQKISDQELALLEIMEDPIWFGEFMRSTGYGETKKELWPSRKFTYRDYQKQVLSDKSTYISLIGGRAIGKCQPGQSRIYTIYGYKTLGELEKLPFTIVYAQTPNNTLEQRRAVVVKDKRAATFKITTVSGHRLEVTANHPILTPAGFVETKNLTTNDSVAVITKLPSESTQNAFSWHELRIIGYTGFFSHWSHSIPIPTKYKQQLEELKIIADRFFMLSNYDHKGVFSFKRRPSSYTVPITQFYRVLNQESAKKVGASNIPASIKNERLSNIQIIMEALFSQFAKLSRNKITLTLPHPLIYADIQELLLRFGIESHFDTALYIDNAWDVYTFWQTFTIPGVAVTELQKPQDVRLAQPTEYLRYDAIQSINQSAFDTQTYAVYVYGDQNYISDNIVTHNTVLLEDKILYDVVNNRRQLVDTPEMLLTTANQAQMTPLLNKLIIRFTTSKLLRSFLQNRINKTDGTMSFPIRNPPVTLHFRIAGSKSENNVVGLHLPRVIIDESQIYPMGSFTQLLPVVNTWEPNVQFITAGVPNSIRNSVLFLNDQKDARYKRYRIPAHNNPYYSYDEDVENQKRYGGIQDDRYQNLVLGRHGAASTTMIPRETIQRESFPFFNLRYSSLHKVKGGHYIDILARVAIPEKLQKIVFAIDTGFVDPTIIQVIGLGEDSIWRTYIRIRLQRIEFHEQEEIIHFLAQLYNPTVIAIDIGAGG